MQYSDDRHHLRIAIDTRACDIPADERTRMQTLLAPLGEAVQDFPASELGIKVIYHPHSQLYHVEFDLHLPGQTLFTGEEDSYLDTAFQRGLRKLLRKAEAYKEHPDRRAVEVAGQRAALDRGV